MRNLLGTVLIAATLWTAAPCVAQVAGIPADVVSSKKPLSADQLKKMADVVEPLLKQIEGGESADVVQARNDLIDIARYPLISEPFRREFSALLVKRFEPLAKPATAYQATNSFLVARFIGTAEAIDFLLDNADKDSQPDQALRVAASTQLPKALAPAQLSGAQLEALAKRVVASAKDESSWIVLAHLADTVGEMLRQKGVAAAQVDSIAQSEGALLNDIAEHFLKGGSPDLVQALHRGLLLARNQSSNLPASARAKLMNAISANLAKVAALKTAPPSEVSARADLGSSFVGATNAAEVLLKVGTGNG
jgi:hypothetical protein